MNESDRPTGTDDTKDDGFVIESHSAPADPAPVDTTATMEAAPVTEPSTEPPATEPGTEEASASAAEASAGANELEPAAGRPRDEKGKFAKSEPAKKGEPTLKERTAKLRKEVDQATYELRETQRQLAAARAERDRVLGEGKSAPAAPDATAAAKPADKPAEKPATPARPEHPKYRDFDDDVKYEEAVAKWRTDDAKWLDDRFTEREAALRTELTTGVEARFKTDAERRQAEAADRTLVSTVAAVSAKHEDWKEKSAALADIRSSWFDPAVHGTATTPFLSDLSHALLTQGREEGAELLYWLGSDPARAQVLADLYPTRALRDAIVHAPSVFPLLEHFATPDGVQEFEGLTRMHPIHVMQTIGALSARLTAPSGSVSPAPHPITGATPPARPPAGAPGARGATPPASTKQSFDEWHLNQDIEELTNKLIASGTPADAARTAAVRHYKGAAVTA